MEKVKLEKTNIGIHRTEELKKGEQIQIDRDAYLEGGDNSLKATHANATSKVKKGLHIKALEQTVRNDAYGISAKSILSEGDRNKEITKKGSELYKKSQNKLLCVNAKEEYDKKSKAAMDKFSKTKLYEKYVAKSIVAIDDVDVDDLSDEVAGFETIFHACSISKNEFDKSIFEKYISSDDESRYAALDSIVENFINMNFDFDFTNDDSFSRETLRLEHVKACSEAVIILLRDNPAYWADLTDENKAIIMEKNVQAAALINYANARNRLICDDYYSTHLNKELSINEPIGDAAMTALYIINAEGTYRELLEVDTNKSQTEIHQSASTKADMDLEYVEKRNMLGVVKGKQQKSKESNSCFLDIFGGPLKLASRFMREARRIFGKNDYEEGRTLYRKFPNELKNIGADEYALKKHKTKDAAPAIELGKYFADPLKLQLKDKINSARVAQILGDDDKMYRSDVEYARRVFKEFIEAATMYSDIRGIVNADTTLIEMTALDKMSECVSNLEKVYNNTPGAMLKNLFDFAKECCDPLYTRGKGKLSAKMSQADLNFYANNLSAIVLDTDIEDNMEESNIKDIPLFTHLPNINDVKQSTIGDCYLVAAMTTLVAADPDAVLSMFHDYEDGNVLVRLYKPYDANNNELDTEDKIKAATSIQYKPVYYKLRKHYETGDGVASDCTWPQLIEKAYAAGGFNMKGVSRVDENGHLSGIEKELTCGTSNRALAALCGKSAVTQNLKKDAEAIRAAENIRTELTPFRQLIRKDSILWERLGAGIPPYIYYDMHDGIMEAEYYMQDAEYYRNRIRISCESLARDVGTTLMQVKKNCIKNGIDYFDLITTFANVTGIKLSDDWDEQTRCEYINASDVGTVHVSEFNLDKDNQLWQSLVDIDFLSKKYVDKFDENLDAVLSDKPVAYDEQGFDIWAAFEMEYVSNVASEMERLSKQEPKNFAENAVANVIKAFDVTECFEFNDGIKGMTAEEYHKQLNQRWKDNANPLQMSDCAFNLIHKGEFDYNRMDKKTLFLRSIMEAIDKGGAVEVSINHFVTALDYKYELKAYDLQGNPVDYKLGDPVDDKVIKKEYYILIKDPFNVYNHTYLTKDDGSVGNSEDGFFDVLSLSGNEIKRHLDPDGNDKRSIYGGFRGLSWWKLDDLYKETKYISKITSREIRK